VRARAAQVLAEEAGRHAAGDPGDDGAARQKHVGADSGWDLCYAEDGRPRALAAYPICAQIQHPGRDARAAGGAWDRR
jgi:hypothetical protein